MKLSPSQTFYLSISNKQSLKEARFIKIELKENILKSYKHTLEEDAHVQFNLFDNGVSGIFFIKPLKRRIKINSFKFF